MVYFEKDIHLPEMSGFEITRHFREIEGSIRNPLNRGSRQKIIGMSSSLDAAIVNAAEASGMDYFSPKTGSSTDFIRTLKTVLAAPSRQMSDAKEEIVLQKLAHSCLKKRTYNDTRPSNSLAELLKQSKAYYFPDTEDAPVLKVAALTVETPIVEA